MDSPPPPLPALPASGGAQVFRIFAKYSWASVLFAFALSIGLEVAAKRVGTADLRPLMVYGMGLIVLTGIVAGVVALAGVRRHGRKGILWPAVVGLGVWTALIAIGLPSFLRARQAYQERMASRAGASAPTPAGQLAKKLAPVVRIPGGTRVEDGSLHFSMDVPSRFEAVADPSMASRFRHAWARRATDSSAPRILGVSGIGGPMPRVRMKPADLPAGSGATLEKFSWRGVGVDAARVPEKDGASTFVTFNVRIPLKPEGIQLTMGGPAEAESEVLSLLMQVLASLDGENAW